MDHRKQNPRLIQYFCDYKSTLPLRIEQYTDVTRQYITWCPPKVAKIYEMFYFEISHEYQGHENE